MCALALVSLSAAASPSTEALLRQGDEYVKAGNLARARQAYQSAIAAGARLEKDYPHARNLGVCYLQGTPRDLARAEKWLQLAVAAQPDALDARLYLAQSLAWSGKQAAALEQYRHLAQAQPDNGDYAIGQALALYSMEKKDEAFALLQSFIDAHAADLNTRLEYARVLAYSRRFTAAMDQYQVILNADPNNVEARVGIAKLTSWQNDLPRALELFNRILITNPNLYDAQVGKAFTLFWMGKDSEARPLFEQAARRNPSDTEVARALKLLGRGEQKVARGEPGPPSAMPAVATPVAQPVAAAPQAAPLVAVPAAPAKPSAPAVSPLQEQAENATARKDYLQAIQCYREMLREQPANREYRLRLARVLSWSKDYAGSEAEYDLLLQKNGADLEARLERARVLSWARNYDASIAEYRRVLQQLDETSAAGAPATSSEVKLELARVLSWAGHYQESLAMLNQLLPPSRHPAASDRAALLERARVLSYERQYAQAIRSYDQAIALDPHDYEARVGKAQTIYWQGKLTEAAAQLHSVLAEQPNNPDASFVLAAVEHGRGNDRAAIRLVQQAPANDDTRQLKDSILLDQRPVLRFSYGFQDDREIDSSGPQTTIKPLRYTTAFAFNVSSGVRLEVENTYTDVLTSNRVLSQFGSDANANSTLARLSFRVSPWLRLTAGAGEATTGGGTFMGAVATRRQNFIYEVHPVFTSGGFRLDLSATRGAFPYTPLAVQTNVVQTRESVAPTYEWRRRLRMGLEYWYAQYDLRTPDPARPSFATAATGGTAFLTPILHHSDRVTVEAGLRYDSFANQESVVAIDNPVTGIGSAGFFTPRIYQRYAGTGLVAWTVQKHFGLDVHGTFGPQRLFGFPQLAQPPAKWGTTGSVGSQLTFPLGRWQPYFAYDYFSTNTPAGPALPLGSYRSHLFVTGITIRF